MSIFPRRRTAVVRTFLAALALAGVLAGCGGSADDDTPEVAAAAAGSSGVGATTADAGQAESVSKDPKEAALAFVRCMRKEGIDMPDPSADGGIRMTAKADGGRPEGPDEELEAAQGKCEYLMDAARPKLTDAEIAENKERMLAFARCMREHGVDMPDPIFEEGGKVKVRMSGGPDEETMQEAQKACAEEGGGFSIGGGPAPDEMSK